MYNYVCAVITEQTFVSVTPEKNTFPKNGGLRPLQGNILEKNNYRHFSILYSYLPK